MDNTNKHDNLQKLLSKIPDISMAGIPGPFCPGVDQLVDYAFGRLEFSERAQVEFHLPECLACRLITIRVRASQPLWTDISESNIARVLAMAFAPD